MEREELEGEGIPAVGIDWCIYLYKKQVLPLTFYLRLCGFMAQAVYKCYSFPATAMLLSTHTRKYLQLTGQNLF